ncbi:MAG: helix-turn-helix domain-containing protein [Ruthenibacterium lactatiformans]
MEQGLEQLPLHDEARKALAAACRPEAAGARAVHGSDVTHSDYYYPLEAEQQLLQYVRAGDASAQEVLGRIFTANFETKRVSAAAARSLLYQLAATLQRLANSDALAQGGGADFDEQLVEQVVNSSSIDYARRRLSEHIARLAAAHENRAQSKTEKLVERIAAYIDNCAESEFPDLTVLSEAFGVTPQYISNVFKKYRDENVKDYIARRKLAQAKALLTGTDLPVREVAARLGYAGEIGSIRLFRKYEGTTPGDYRAQHK